MTVNGKRELALAVETAQLYDSLKTEHFLKRDNEVEWISYRGSTSQYRYSLNNKEIIKRPYFKYMDRDSLVAGFYPRSYFENKIVLMGFLGNYLNDPTMESRFYTPMNTTFAGRSMPDMMGVEMHANIISMILNNDFINEVNPVLNISANILVLLLNVFLFIRLHKNQTTWYDSLCFIIPITQVLFFSWLRLELFSTYSLRIELEGIIYLVAFVSFAVNLYYGPLSSLIARIRSRPREGVAETLKQD